MLRNKVCATNLIALLAFSLSTPFVSAQNVDIDWTDRGWYDRSGVHYPSNNNYSAGDLQSCSGCEDDYHNFFVYDLSEVTQPISSATLRLTLGLYETADLSETYELHDVTTPITSLLNGTAGLAAWNDLGTGVVYGSVEITGGHFLAVIEIPLNSSAIAALNSNHGLFASGGSITSLDGVQNTERAFSTPGVIGFTRLQLTLVPEPSTFVLLAIGAISLLGRRTR